MTLPYFTLGDAARGTIEPREWQQERLDEFTSRLASGEFHRVITNGSTIPARCVDGRNLTAGIHHPLAPNAAGGSESVFVADDLTVKRFAAPDGTVLSAYRAVLDALVDAGYSVGGHTDSHASDDKSGCGANDRLPEIYQFIATRASTLRNLATKLGVAVPDETHLLIEKNAAARTQFSKGAEVFTLLAQKANDEYVDTLDGEHNEAVAVVNTRLGTTLDRDALYEVFGDKYEAFNVDVWSFSAAAGIGSQNSEETAQKLVAMVYYNLATTMVLAGPGLRVVVLS